ncbi:hypothetical protein FXO38_17060 [Capsicum annuum]|nr:hypothetical protein FXO38_17060 [Capsicum annuum]KAF3658318.1 hypothetical protein FXO37_14463 [Capsicum annuum]
MDKRNWLWKRDLLRRALVKLRVLVHSLHTQNDTLMSSGKFIVLNNSSLVFKDFSSDAMSLRFDPLKETPKNVNQSPEVTSKAATIDDKAKESPKKLIEKLSAALVNVSAKEDLVKQHAKVAEEVVADGNTNEQTPNEQDVGSNVQNADQDVGVAEQSVAEQSANLDGDTNEQVPNEQDMGATEQNVDQYGDTNKQVSDEQDLGAAEQNANQHEDINEQNHDQDGSPQ